MAPFQAVCIVDNPAENCNMDGSEKAPKSALRLLLFLDIGLSIVTGSEDAIAVAV
jgi:hypothetical protein